MKCEMFDDYLAYNEDSKQSVEWTTYGDNEEYFLSKTYEFKDDFLEPIHESDRVLINGKIDKNNTKEKLIEKSLQMVF